jgi:hypothetical protein
MVFLKLLKILKCSKVKWSLYVINWVLCCEDVWRRGGIAGTRRECSALLSCRLTLGRSPGTHWTGGWVVPRAGLDAIEKRRVFPLAGNRTPAIQPVARSHTGWGIPAHGWSRWSITWCLLSVAYVVSWQEERGIYWSSVFSSVDGYSLFCKFAEVVYVQSDSKLRVLSGFPWPIYGNSDNNLELFCILLQRTSRRK